MRSFKEFLTESNINYKLMNTNRFHPTNVQMKELEDTTNSIFGKRNISVLALQDVNIHDGTATYKKGNQKYKAYRLKANDRWYLSSDYETV